MGLIRQLIKDSDHAEFQDVWRESQDLQYQIKIWFLTFFLCVWQTTVVITKMSLHETQKKKKSLLQGNHNINKAHVLIQIYYIHIGRGRILHSVFIFWEVNTYTQ